MLKYVFIYTVINLTFHLCLIDSIEFDLQIHVIYKDFYKKVGSVGYSLVKLKKNGVTDIVYLD